MDILIKNMEMPAEVNHPLFIRISSDGHIARGDFLKGGFIETEAKAVALPSHGELIDRSLLKAVSYEIMRFPDEEANEMYLELIDNAPTIVEATE